MGGQEIHICVPMSAPESRGVATTRKIWNRNALTVGFLDGDPRQHKLVLDIARGISSVCDMRFVPLSSPHDAAIRVSFVRGIGSWSYVGTDALLAPRERATMNFGWLRPDMTSDNKVARAAVLHEFGHALGLRHEHNHPENDIPWNKPAVYEWFAKIDWPKEDVDRLYFARLDRTQSRFSEFDTESVMIYPIHQKWTIGDYEVPWRHELSAGDKEFLGKCYPFENTVYLPSIQA